MNNVIVVGVDGSDSASAAAREAAALAAELGGSLHIVSAVEQVRSEVINVGNERFEVDTLDNANEIAQREAYALRDVLQQITIGAGEGKPHEVLISAATALDARLIVVGNRRVQGLGRLLGSVATSVLQHAPCAVYVAKTV